MQWAGLRKVTQIKDLSSNPRAAQPLHVRRNNTPTHRHTIITPGRNFSRGGGTSVLRVSADVPRNILFFFLLICTLKDGDGVLQALKAHITVGF